VRRRFAHDERGVTIVEFALVAPVMLLLLMGLFDLCYRAYAQSILTGAVQAAGRRGTLEGNASTTATATLDATVIRQMRAVANNLTWNSSRKSYRSFSRIGAEPFDDVNHNGRYDSGECYSDINNNNRWDADAGNDGQGGANDITVYTMTVTYPRLFPLTGLMGVPPTQAISASTRLKNQPYGSQAADAPETRCG
jgi:Flp pilus assembly pilin Flp